MNFNASDSLTLRDVVEEPLFLDFLRKWELSRRPSSTIRAIFSRNRKICKNYSLLAARTLQSHEFYLHQFSLNFLSLFSTLFHLHTTRADSESPAMSVSGTQSALPKSPEPDQAHEELPNQISAAYEVPQFPIEQIEKKLLLQRHLTAK